MQVFIHARGALVSDEEKKRAFQHLKVKTVEQKDTHGDCSVVCVCVDSSTV
jgi:hypothetical protein